MAEPSGSPQRATWLGWIPLPALILAGDGSAVAANEGWADLSQVPAVGQAWLEAVEPAFRPDLRSMLHLAATAGTPGRTDCLVTGPHGAQWSRWWWQPAAPGQLVVCVALIGSDPAGSSPVADDRSGPPGAERRQAVLPAGTNVELAMVAVNRIFRAGLAIEAAASLLPGSSVTLVLRALDDLGQLADDIRDAALHPLGGREDPPALGEMRREAGALAIATATPQSAGRVRELLDSVVNHIFKAGMSLQAATDLPRDAAAQHITEALHRLDEVVWRIRDHVFTEHRQGAQPDRASEPRMRTPEPAASAANHMAVVQDRWVLLRERWALLQGRSAVLQEQIVQTAYTLHFTATDTAALLEEQRTSRNQPGPIDYSTEIKRWRIFADQAKQMAERWEHLEDQPTAGD